MDYQGIKQLNKEKEELLNTYKSLERESFFCETADHAKAINNGELNYE